MNNNKEQRHATSRWTENVLKLRRNLSYNFFPSKGKIPTQKHGNTFLKVVTFFCWFVEFLKHNFYFK